MTNPQVNDRKSIWQDKIQNISPEQESIKNQSTAHTVSSGSNDVKIKPSKYDGLTPWMDYLSHFEMCALVNMWSEHQKVSPKGLNDTIRLVVELEAYNKAESRTMKSMGHLRHTTSDERTEASNSPDTVVSIENMATWMQTMEDNLQSLTKEMMTLKDLNSQKKFQPRGETYNTQSNRKGNLLRYQLDQIVVSEKVCLSEGQTLPTNDVLVEARTSDKLSRSEKQKVKSLAQEYESLFAETDSDLGKTSLVKHEIETGNARPFKEPPRRTPFHLSKVVNDNINKKLENRVIEPSHSPWAAGIVLVKKKDDTYRFCVDYRKLNSVTINQDAFPPPRIDESLDHLAGNSLYKGKKQIKLTIFITFC
ncbi:unnamed protein product [Mytilus edulis]|uniref:Uncharacterized protein n=1 Tax=Mytilus edulis TaxID=6550 RepID=A0A8S3RFG0_MYTED|nr:unnamed protein product [Mytilus edulis]